MAHVTPAEAAFKAVVRDLLRRGVWPGPRAIADVRNLNGAQTRWRREVLEAAGYRKHPETGRWGGRGRCVGDPCAS